MSGQNSRPTLMSRRSLYRFCGSVTICRITERRKVSYVMTQGERLLEEVLRMMALAGLGSFFVLTTGCGSSPQEGRILYESNGCASCHGPEGHGDGPVAESLQPRPTDLRHAAEFRNGSEETAIAQTLLTGIAIHHAASGAGVAHHDLVMPAFSHLSQQERRSLAQYVISLRRDN